MALTRPKLSQLDSSSSVFTDPLLVLHQGATAANIDVGFLFNRANGLVSNVALYWSETDKAFYTTFTNSGGATDANLVPTTYANLVTNNLTANSINTLTDVTITGNLTVNGSTTTLSATNSVVADSLMELNTGAGSNANDLGFIFERGSTGDNAAIIWDESADAFVLGTTTATGASTGDLTVTAGALSIGSLTLGGTAVTSTAAELNLLDGVTATTAEINYLSGVTSAIQTQIDNISSDFYIAADNGSNDTFTTGQTLTFTGNTGIDTTVANNQVFIAHDTGVIATLTDAQTLTNKTLTSPTINTPSISGNITLGGNVLPNLNEVYSLGTADSRFATLFVANSTIYLGESALSLIGGTLYVDGNPVTGAGDAWPGYNGNYDLAKALAQTDAETPFTGAGTDSFGVSIALLFDNMDPAGSIVTYDYADSYTQGTADGSAEAYLGA